jgi:hypothetical protein
MENLTNLQGVNPAVLLLAAQMAARRQAAIHPGAAVGAPTPSQTIDAAVVDGSQPSGSVALGHAAMSQGDAAGETVDDGADGSDAENDDAVEGEAACTKRKGGKGQGPWYKVTVSSRVKLALLLLMVQLRGEAKGMPDPETVNTRAAGRLQELKKELEAEAKARDPVAKRDAAKHLANIIRLEDRNKSEPSHTWNALICAWIASYTKRK